MLCMVWCVFLFGFCNDLTEPKRIDEPECFDMDALGSVGSFAFLIIICVTGLMVLTDVALWIIALIFYGSSSWFALVYRYIYYVLQFIYLLFLKYIQYVHQT